MRSVTLWSDGKVDVFDDQNRSMIEYTGKYDQVKARILIAAGPDIVFAFGHKKQIKIVTKLEWAEGFMAF